MLVLCNVFISHALFSSLKIQKTEFYGFNYFTRSCRLRGLEIICQIKTCQKLRFVFFILPTAEFIVFRKNLSFSRKMNGTSPNHFFFSFELVLSHETKITGIFPNPVLINNQLFGNLTTFNHKNT